MIDIGAVGIWQTSLLGARNTTPETEYRETDSYDTERDEIK